MNIKNLKTFGGYHSMYIYSENFKFLVKMFLTAKSFSEWVRVYRNLHWALIRKDFCHVELATNLRITSLRMMLTTSTSKSEIMEELLHYNDYSLIEELNPMKGNELNEEYLKISFEHLL